MPCCALEGGGRAHSIVCEPAFHGRIRRGGANEHFGLKGTHGQGHASPCAHTFALTLMPTVTHTYIFSFPSNKLVESGGKLRSKLRTEQARLAVALRELQAEKEKAEEHSGNAAERNVGPPLKRDTFPWLRVLFRPPMTTGMAPLAFFGGRGVSSGFMKNRVHCTFACGRSWARRTSSPPSPSTPPSLRW